MQAYNPLERAYGYRVRRQQDRERNAARVRDRALSLASAQPSLLPVPGGADEGLQGVDVLPEADQDFIGQQFLIQTENETEADRIVTVQQDGSGHFYWRDMINDPTAWNAPYVTSWGSAGSSNGQFGTMRGIRDKPSTGHIYVSSDNRIQKFTANGTYVSTIATSGSGNGAVNTPWQLWELAGVLFVADSGNNRYQWFSTADVYGGKAGTLGSGGSFTGQVNGPRGITLYPDSRRLVLDTGNLRVVAFETTDAALGADATFNIFGPIGAGATEIHIVNGWVYHVDTANHRIFAIQLNNTGAFSIGSQGAGDGQFESPKGMAVDARGNIYVADTGNHRIQVFDRNGLFLGKFGSVGSAEGNFVSPSAITITKDYIYVADDGNSRVQVFRNPLSLIVPQGLVLLHNSGKLVNVTSYSVNNVFDRTYRNYVIHVNVTAVAAVSNDVYLRLRRNGGDDTSASYINDYGYLNNGVAGGSGPVTTVLILGSHIGGGAQIAQMGVSLNVEAPATTQTTYMYGPMTVYRTDTALYTGHSSGIHAVADAYDGFTILSSGGAQLSMEVRVYGRGD